MQDKKTSLRISDKKNKLIPKDLNESLGKLPPQAIDMEEAVLGALMLEKHAIGVVDKFLKADHFYHESHKSIYASILKLQQEGSPIDMRTVRAQISKDGLLEMVGGAYYISELTSKVSSASNIEYHARVIVEQAIKRSIIALASQLQNDSYEETTDSFEILERSQELLKQLYESTTLENTEDKIKKEWKTRLLTEKPPAEIPLICIAGSVIATLANHSLILGKKKSRKTLFITWLIQQFFLQNNKAGQDDVLIFDTEQGKSHVWKMRETIKKLTGFELPLFFLRGMAPADRRDFIKHTIKYWKNPPKIIVIDGVRDLMSNINDADETTEVIVWLETLILEHNVHIMEILHLNKTDNNARGHIGSELLNKAQVTIELEKDPKSGVTIVKCESSREKEFDSFSFVHGADDLPEITGMPVQGNVVPEDKRKSMIRSVFEDGDLKYKDLVRSVELTFGLSKNKSEKLINDFRKQGWIMKSGKDRDPTAVYKLMLSDSDEPLIPYAEAVQQVSLFPPTPPDEVISEDLPF